MYTYFKQNNAFERNFNTVDIYYEGVVYGTAFKFDINFGINNESIIFSPLDSIHNIGGFSLNTGKIFNSGKRIQFPLYFNLFDVIVIKRNSDIDVGLGIGAEIGLKLYLSEQFGLGGAAAGRISFVQRDDTQKEYTGGRGYRLSCHVFYSLSKKKKS